MYIRNVLWQKRNRIILGFVRFDDDLQMADDLAQLIHSIPARLSSVEMDEWDEWFINNTAKDFLSKSNTKHYMYEQVRRQINEIKNK